MQPTEEQHRQIVAAAQRAVYRYFRNPQTADVEDLAQEVEAKVLAHWDGFDASKGQWTTWVNTIARRTAIDWGRKKRPVRLVDGFDAASSPSLPNDGAEQAAADIRLLLPVAPEHVLAVLAALNEDLFPPSDSVKKTFERIFRVSWEESRELPEWRHPSPEFLAARTGKSKNSVIDQPLCRFRAWLLEKIPALARHLGIPQHGLSEAT